MYLKAKTHFLSTSSLSRNFVDATIRHEFLLHAARINFSPFKTRPPYDIVLPPPWEWIQQLPNDQANPKNSSGLLDDLPSLQECIRLAIDHYKKEYEFARFNEEEMRKEIRMKTHFEYDLRTSSAYQQTSKRKIQLDKRFRREEKKRIERERISETTHVMDWNKERRSVKRSQPARSRRVKRH